MPKDYVHRAHGQSHNWRKKSASKQTHHEEEHHHSIPWKALSAAFLIIFLVTAAFFFVRMRLRLLQQAPLGKPGVVVEQATPIAPVEKTQNISKAIPRPIHFDFYKMLPESSVSMAKITPIDSMAVVDPKVHYLLQVASLSSQDDIQAFQDKLSELGLRGKVVPVKRGQFQWYRIQLGPFAKLSSAQSVRDRLQQEHISSIILKIRHS